MAVQPEDQKEGGDRNDVSTPCLWALLVFNGGPDLIDVVVEVQSEDAGEPTNRYEIPVVEEGTVARLFAGGPSEEPVHGLYRLWAKTRGGLDIFLDSRFQGLKRPAHIPANVAEQSCFPLAPAATWQPEEYVRVLASSGLHSESPSRSPAALAFSRRVARLLRGVTEVPSDGAAREIAWAAVRSVFGAQDEDLDLSAVRQKVLELSTDVEELAEFLIELRRPATHVPESEICLAMVPGEETTLYLLNCFGQDLEDVSVRVRRMSWGETATVMEPLEFKLGKIKGRSAALITHLDAEDLLCDLECVVSTGPIHPYVETSHRGCFPEGAATEFDNEIKVDLLGGTKAQVRRMEITAFLEGSSTDDSDRVAA